MLGLMTAYRHVKLENNLNAGDFTSSPYAAEALSRLNNGEWRGFELRDLHYVFSALETAHQYRARNNNLKATAPEWPILRNCLHALGDVFAPKWLECGEDVFREKLAFYHRMSRVERAKATDELFYQALLRLDESRRSDSSATRH